MTTAQDVKAGAIVAYNSVQAAVKRIVRTLKAIYTVTKKHVPAWIGAILTVCLFIPGPLDEFLVLLVIAGMIGFKPVMRRELFAAIRGAWTCG